MKFKWILAIGIVAALLLSACEQTESDIEELNTMEELSENVTIAEEIVAGTKAAEATSSDISTARFAGHLFNGNMMQGGAFHLFGKGFPSCATVTVDSDEFPKTITIDYGDGCAGRLSGRGLRRPERAGRLRLRVLRHAMRRRMWRRRLRRRVLQPGLL